MARKKTIKLLLINESENEGERLVSVFRNAGRVARAHRASSADDLYSSLENEQWDLLIANDKHPEISVEQCLEQLSKLDTDLPVIIIRDDSNAAITAMEKGASDVVATEDDQRLIFASFRELNNLDKRRELAIIQGKLDEAETRSEQLMSQSQDAIAYVADGMLISVNPLFATRFGYGDVDDLDCLPIVDLIALSNHEKFKSLLKTQINSTGGTTDFPFTGLDEQGQEFSAAMQLTNAVYDGDDCIQISIKDEIAAKSGSGGGNVDHDPVTGLYSQQFFNRQLASFHKQASAGNSIASLLYLGLDNYTALRAKQGLATTENVLKDLAQFIAGQTDDSQFLSHYFDDAFCLLLEDTGAEKSQEFARKLCKSVEGHIIEVDGQSIQCTLSIGIVVVDNQAPEEPIDLVNCVFSASEALRDGTGNDVSLYIPVREKKSLGRAQGDEDLDSTIEEHIEDGVFSIQFQPVVSLRGSSGDHYEVQLKIEEDGELTDVNDFLAKLNFNEVNTRLDRWIILEATKKLAIKREQGEDIRLFINQTANTLQDETLLPWLSVALKAGNLPPESLIFQFREEDINDCLKPATKFAKALRETGCHMSIAGYGSMAEPYKALTHLNASFVKIAPKYITDLTKTNDIDPLRQIVSKAAETETKSIISYVENASALASLWQIGVDFIQGEYMASPSDKMDYEFSDMS